MRGAGLAATLSLEMPWSGPECETRLIARSKGDPMAEPGIQGSALSAVPLFADLPPEDLEAVMELGHPVSFAAGEPIVEKGQRADAMYIILSGTAEVDVGGRYHSLGPGDFLGEMALLSSKTRMATVKAAEPVEAL